MDTIFAATYGTDIRAHFQRRASRTPTAHACSDITPSSSTTSSPALSDSEWAAHDPSSLAATHSASSSALGLLIDLDLHPQSAVEYQAPVYSTTDEPAPSEPSTNTEYEHEHEPSLGAEAFAAYVDSACDTLGGLVQRLSAAAVAQGRTVLGGVNGSEGGAPAATSDADKVAREMQRRISMSAWRDQHGFVEGWLD